VTSGVGEAAEEGSPSSALGWHEIAATERLIVVSRIKNLVIVKFLIAEGRGGSVRDPRPSQALWALNFEL
jgi:hypothetical protein